MDTISVLTHQIVVVQMDEETLTLKDLRHDGTLVFKHFDDNSPRATLNDLKRLFEAGDLLLRIKGHNEIGVSEGFDFTGYVELHNVVLTDPILENTDLLDVSLPNNTFLSVRFASLERVSTDVKSKKIFLAYGLYAGTDLTTAGDINLVNGQRCNLDGI